MAKVLVTGGAGFIGSHVVRKLVDQGDEVVIIDNFNEYYSPALKHARMEYLIASRDKATHRVDIADFSSLEEIFKKEKFDTICHLAAQAGVLYSLKNPQVYESSNLKGTLNLLILAQKYGVPHFVFASSSSVYGETKNFPTPETESIEHPISLYAATKVSGEAMVHAYAKMFGLKATVLRFFNVYGPWTRPDSALFIFTRKISEGERMKVFNFGEQEKDFTYIDDIVSGIVAAIKKPFDYEVFNLGNSTPVLLKKYISLIEQEVGQQANQEYLPIQAGDVSKSHADITKAKLLLGYDPATSVDQGIKNFVAWYKEYNERLGLSKMNFTKNQ